MAVSVLCPGCRTSYPVTEDLLGKKIRCKKCQETFTATAAKNGRPQDDRIQTRPSAKAARGDNAAPRSKAGAKKSGNGLLIGAILGGLLLVVGGGFGVWMVINKDDASTNNGQASANPPVLPLNNLPINVNPGVTPDANQGDTPKANQGESKGGVTNPTLSTDPRPAPLPRIKHADFRADIVERVKQSAVMIQSTVAEGSADGSGWIAEPGGIIVTNAHVIFMKEAAREPPQKVEVIVHAGIKDKERRYEAKILAVDREEDLAVLKINGKDLPDPLPIALSHELIEGQKLMTLGFPLGRGLKQSVDAGSAQETLLGVKARFTTVAGRFRAKDGSVKYIQVEGGVDGGNSGGAVVDTSGHVVAIVVAEARGTQIKFVIPSEHALHLLQGRILKIVPGQAVGSGGAVKQSLAAMVADPMKRIDKITADFWSGPKPNASKGELMMRPATDREPLPVAGDANKVTVPVSYNPSLPVGLGESQTATIDVTLPTLPASHVYWFRPKYKLKDGKDRWGEAMVVEMGRHPVESSPANLTLHHKAESERRIHLVTRATTGFETTDGFAGAQDLKLIAKIGEKTRLVERNGSAKVRLQYNDLRFADKDLDDAIRRQLKGLETQVKGLGAEVTISPDGRMRNLTPDFANVTTSPLVRGLLRSLNTQVVEALENVAVPLPNRELQAGDTWTADTYYTVLITRPPQNALFRMTCKYVGSRVRNGRREAVIEMTGRVVRGQGNNSNSPGGNDGGNPPTEPPISGGPDGRDGPGGGRGGRGGGNDDGNDGQRRGLQGFARGAAIVDLETGYITLSRLQSDLAIEIRLTEDTRLIAGLILETTLTRNLSKDEPKELTDDEIEALLPNQPKFYKPMVGSIGPGQTAADVTPAAPLTGSEEARTSIMKPDVLDLVKKRTVFIDVEREDGGGSGSGWLAEQGGIVVTNSHVVGMVDKAKRPPTSIKVTFDAGLPTARTFPAKILSLDRAEDLAVLKVDAPNLPEPFRIVSSADMVEGHALSVVGFPRGKHLARGAVALGAVDLTTEVKVRTTRMSGLIMNVDGTPHYVQVEGGADPGNSGGPVVDSQGNVRSVLVAGFPGRQIVFTIPGEYAARVLQGYPMEVNPGLAFLDGSSAKQPMEIKFSDPLKRVKRVAIDIWLGNNDKPRPGTETTPKPVAGDGERQTFQLNYDPEEQVARGDFPLPPLSPGQVYWMQPHFTNGTGKEQWSRATVYSPDGPPVEKRRAKLAVEHRRGMERDVEMTSLSRFRYNVLGVQRVEGNPLKVNLTERTLAVGQNKSASIQIEYKELTLDWKTIFPGIEQIPELESALRQALRPYLNLIRGVIMVVTVSKEGRMTMARNGLSFGNVPLPAVIPMSRFNSQIFSSLQAMTFPLPGEVVPYGHTWTFDTDLFIGSRRRTEAALFKMNFKYVGVRDRGGRQEAVVEINGTLAQDLGKSTDDPDVEEKPAGDAGKAAPGFVERYQSKSDGKSKAKGKDASPKKGPKGMYGKAHGIAHVDVDSGTVTFVKMTLDLDVEIVVKDPESKQDVPTDAGGTIDVVLKRNIVAQGR